MKRRALAILTVLFLTAAPLSASAGGPKPKPPKPPASKPVKPAAVKAVKPAVKANGSRPVKATTPKAPKPAKATKSVKVDTKKSPKTTAASTTPEGTTPPATNDRVPLTKVQEKLQRNTNLASKLRGRLPEGTDLMKAAYGFKNLGQFVAAVNVSNNLDIPFAKLKRLMVKEGYSLGQSIQELKPRSSGTVEARRAEADAQRTIAATETPVASTTTAAKPKAKSRKAVGAQ